jgi:hypothetical protein
MVQPAQPAQSVAEQIRLWTPVIITVLASLFAVMFWLQNSGDEKYMTKESGENLKEKMTDMKIDMQQIKNQNIEIIQRLSSIDAKVEKK